AAVNGTVETGKRLILLALHGQAAGVVVMSARILRRQLDRAFAHLLRRRRLSLSQQRGDFLLQPGILRHDQRLLEDAGRILGPGTSDPAQSRNQPWVAHAFSLLAFALTMTGHFSCQRFQARPGFSTRNCTRRVCSTSVTYTVRPSGPPKHRLLGNFPSTSTSCRIFPSGESTTTVPLPWRVM